MSHKIWPNLEDRRSIPGHDQFPAIIDSILFFTTRPTSIASSTPIKHATSSTTTTTTRGKCCTVILGTTTTSSIIANHEWINGKKNECVFNHFFHVLHHDNSILNHGIRNKHVKYYQCRYQFVGSQGIVV